LSEASNMPVMMELRIRACHVRGQFVAKTNQAPLLSKKNLIAEPAGFDYMRLAHPPVTFAQEKRKVAHRLPAAREFILANGLNEHFPGTQHKHLGLIVKAAFTTRSFARFSNLICQMHLVFQVCQFWS